MTPKAKAKATGKAKAKSSASKPAVLELSKVKTSDLREALPKYNRPETRKAMEKEILGKATWFNLTSGCLRFRV